MSGMPTDVPPTRLVRRASQRLDGAIQAGRRADDEFLAR
jgi:hypothetical protein